MAKFKPQHKRLLWLHDQLSRKAGQHRSLPNCESLAEGFLDSFGTEISSRTIRRDIDHLRELGAPIEYDPELRGYFYFEDDYSLPAFEMSETELFFLCIAERALTQYMGTPIYSKLSSVVDKIRGSIPTDKVTIDPVVVSGRVSFMDAPARKIETEIWEEMSKALSKGRVLEIEYQNPGRGKPTARIIQPYHMVSYRGDWYLIAHCRLRDTMRTFAISRISKVKRTGDHFRIPEGFDGKEYLRNNFGIMRGDKTHKIRIRFDADAAPYALAREWLADQVVKQNKDGSVVLSGTASHLRELSSWVLSWGPSAKVLSPRELADTVKNDMKSALKLYR